MSNHSLTTAATAMPVFVPQEDAWEFSEIRPEARDKARRRYEIACRVAAAPKARKTAVYAECALELEVSFNAIYLPVSEFLKHGDWRYLIDRRIAGSRFWNRKVASGLPYDFEQYWKGLVEDNQRCAKSAYPILLERLAKWRAGDATQKLPGFVVPPPNSPGHKHPRKMSLRDLMRIQPTDIELVANRNGRAAAMKLLPAIYTTRKSGWPCMEYQFDDLWHDFEVLHNGRICRLLEFNAIDFYTGFIFNPGLRPRTLGEDGKQHTLTEKEFRLWAVQFLATIGWSPRGTVLQGERGTAAFRRLGPKLMHWSGGLLKVPLPGMSGQAALIGGWGERAKGNPNAKALKEGMGKLIHNRLANLPGQIGMNPEDRPAYATGRDKETEDLLALQAHLTEPLNLSHLPFEQAAFLVIQEYMRINRRHDHEMEGWMEDNLYTQEYCVDPANDHWIDIRHLPEANRQALAIIAAANPHSLRPRRLSPYEVIAPALPHNLRLSPEAEADCLYDDCRREIGVTGGFFAFEDKDMGPGKFRYVAEYQDRNGFRRSCPNDSEAQLVINPFNPERGFLYDVRGSYLGIVARDHATQRADVDALHRRIGEKERRFKDAKLASEVRHGLKRESALTENTRILLDSLERRSPAPPAAPAYDLSEEYTAADIDYQAPHAPTDTSILLL